MRQLHDCPSPLFSRLSDVCVLSTGCRELHGIISTALDELGREHEQPCAYVARVATSDLHAAEAWLNVNRVSDNNALHAHTAGRWSGVYFVDEGEPSPPGFPHPTGGCLVFRAGQRQEGEMGGMRGADGPAAATSSTTAVAGDAAELKHSFWAVPPKPGTLWLFPGHMPHAVMEQLTLPGMPDGKSARISVAFNCIHAAPPQPLLC